MAQPIEAFRNAFKIPELKQRIIFTLTALLVYRFGSHIPTPGVDGHALEQRMGDLGGILSFYNMFSGGNFANATIFALGIMPNITASIIMSMLVLVIPHLEQLHKQGAEGQKKINEYTRYFTIVLCIVQSIAVAGWLVNMNKSGDLPILMDATPGFGFYFMCILSFTTGTAFLMWLGEQISEHGVGNGMSVIIFASIISGMPMAIAEVIRMISVQELTFFTVGLILVMFVFVVAGTILVTTGQRRIPVQYPRQVKGRKVYGGSRNYLPLRVNQAGVIPIIFASSLLSLPMMLTSSVSAKWVQTVLLWLSPPHLIYFTIYSAMIVVFSFFYTAIIFNPIEMADNMKKYGGVIMGVRPGKATAEYLNHVMTRITLVGSLFLVIVALLPSVLYSFLGINNWAIVSFLGGTSLLIMVGVGLDTVRQMEQHLIMRNYEGFAKGRRIKSRRG